MAESKGETWTLKMPERNIFGYGSLILPQSVLARFDDQVKDFIQEKPDRGDGRSKYLVEKLSKLKDHAIDSDLRFIPAKISGYRRLYCLELPEGNQLAVFKGDESDEVNGVIVTGLDDGQFEELAETEKFYSLETVEADNFELYIDDIELDREVHFFVAEPGKQFNLDTDAKRDSEYEKYILEGVEVLAELWFENREKQKEFIEEFIKDYRRTTFEKQKGKWKRLCDIDNEDKFA